MQVCNGLLIFLGIWYITFQLVAIFQCTPVKFFWERTIPGGHCVDSVSFYIALASTNTFTDIAILFLPMPLVWRLQISLSKKISISGVFLLGAFVCAIALYRISTLPLINDNDITYSNTYAGLWTSIEGSVGVIVACLPSLMPIWQRMRGRKVGYAQYSSQFTQYGNGSKNYRSMGGGGLKDGQNGFDMLSSGTWPPEHSQSQERIMRTTVAHGEEACGTPSDERSEASRHAIGVVTEVHQQIELRDIKTQENQ
ncbi:hypothetical protein N7474_008685 [Penicillium riverlandense]|uniref:uncharacterized protein n=1 Tax=Penicillium riverlandense TaxID=1903569 RepID=UPI0025468D01|nr:uncharacterized protein N7474_008685 [Penicillium riverlandense]KAJ5812384.1 hypothetical protein N7474_008685 [Penicillium riverlandense]